MTTSVAPSRGRTGVRVELARYTVSAGARILYGQRVEGVVRVTDVPLSRGRAYLVERELQQEGSNANAALQALIADYLLCRVRHRMYYADPFSMPIVDGEVLHIPQS
jgi:hypothetical protein